MEEVVLCDYSELQLTHLFFAHNHFPVYSKQGEKFPDHKVQIISICFLFSHVVLKPSPDMGVSIFQLKKVSHSVSRHSAAPEHSEWSKPGQ